jgi:arginyl-tRNA synthetase
MADRESTLGVLEQARRALARAALEAVGRSDDAAQDGADDVAALVERLTRQIRQPQPEHGDLALPAFELAKLVGEKNPAKCAEQVRDHLRAKIPAADHVEAHGTSTSPFGRVEAAGPYVNVTLSPAWLAAQVVPAARAPDYGRGASGEGKTVVVDYSSPNIAKPLAFHHIRSTVIGAALARLHAWQGWRVVGINYLGDWGKQFGLLATGFRRHGDPARRGDAKHLVEVYVEANREADVEGLREKLGAPQRLQALVGELYAARAELEAAKANAQADPKAEKAAEKKLKSVEKKLRAERGLAEDARVDDGLVEHIQAVERAAEAAHAALPLAEQRDQEARVFLRHLEAAAAKLSALDPDGPRLHTRTELTALEPAEADAIHEWQAFREASLVEFRRVYARMGIQFGDTHDPSRDGFEGESFYTHVLDATVDEVAKKPGVRVDQGATIVDVPYADGQPPILLKTRDGTTLYITRDLAAAADRHARFGFDAALYVVAHDQTLHFQQLFRTLGAMGHAWAASAAHVPFGRVHGMSTRRGKVVFLDEVLDEAVEKAREICAASDRIDQSKLDALAEAIGVGAIVFGDLKNLRTSDYTFKLDDVVNFEGLTGPYVQYTHARLASILRRGAESGAGAAPSEHAAWARLELDEERQVLVALARFPEVVAEACAQREPSLLTRGVLDLAQVTAHYLTAGNKDRAKRILLDDDAELRGARLALVDAVRQALKNGLAILGLQAPDAM